MTAFLAQFAAEEYLHRRDKLRAAVAQRRISAEHARENETLWLAIARAAGAVLPEMEVERIWPRGTKGLRHVSEIADSAAWHAELTRARDAAVRKSLANREDLVAQQRAWDMQSLAVNLGCPEMEPMAQIEKEAA